MRRALPILAAGVIAVSSGAAMAAVVTTVGTCNASQSLPDPLPINYPTCTVQFPSFDTMGGTRVLTGVSISGTAHYTAAYTLTHSVLPTTTITAEHTGYTSLWLPGGNVIASGSQTRVLTDVPAYTGVRADFFFQTPFSATTTDVSQYQTDGTTMLTFYGHYRGTLQTTPQLGFTPILLCNVLCYMEIEYTYEIVPAPGAGVILLGGMTMAARRRRR